MSNTLNITCPVSEERVDENTVRLVAGVVVMLTLISLLTNNYFITLFLTLDFGLRAFTNGNASLLKRMCKQAKAWLHVNTKLTNAAPKKFAAALGFAFSLSIAGLQILQYTTAANVLGALLIICAVLESVFGICVGCIIYTVLIKFKTQKNVN